MRGTLTCHVITYARQHEEMLTDPNLQLQNLS